MDDDAKIYLELRFELTRLATALVGPSNAEDVVSKVIIRVLERPGGLAGLREPRPYLVKAVINEARTRFRTSKRRAATTVFIDDELVATSPDLKEVLSIVATLPPRQRAATYLVYWEGHTPTSAAGLMGCRAATVRRYLFLARQKLAEVLDEE